MGNGDVFDGDASVFVEVPKMMTSKCSSEVGDNAVRETKPMDETKRLVFDPLGELVNGDVYIPKTA